MYKIQLNFAIQSSMKHNNKIVIIISTYFTGIGNGNGTGKIPNLGFFIFNKSNREAIVFNLMANFLLKALTGLILSLIRTIWRTKIDMMNNAETRRLCKAIANYTLVQLDYLFLWYTLFNVCC